MGRNSTRLGAGAENATFGMGLGADDKDAKAGMSTRRGLADISNKASANVNASAGAALPPGKKAAVGRGSASALAASENSLANVERRLLAAVPRVEECDQAVANDPRYVTEYATNIVQTMLSTEQKWLVYPQYMSSQTDITPRMRAILCDWLVEVHQKFKLLPQTLYISVNILDLSLIHI